MNAATCDFNKECKAMYSNCVDRRIAPLPEHDKLGSLIAIVVVGFFLMTAAQAIVSEAALAEAGVRTWTIGLTETVLSANPFLGQNDADYDFYAYIYDELMFPNEDGIVTPNLATTYWYMDGLNASTQPIPTDFSTVEGNKSAAEWPLGSIWEYNLTKDVFWSDGERFTADDVVYTIKLQIGEFYSTFWAYQPYTMWITDVQKVDDYKVRIFFADRATHNPIPVSWGNAVGIPMMAKHVLQSYSPVEIAQTWTGAPAVGTGPLMGTDNLAKDIISGESVTLISNPYYNFTDSNDGKQKGVGGVWKRECQIDRLVMRFYADETAITLDLRMGNIDTCKLTPENYHGLKNLPNRPKELNLVSTLSCTVHSDIFHWNVYKEAPGSLNPARLDPALHRASAIATNKSFFIDQVYKGLGMPGVGIISPVYPEWYWTPGDEPSTFNVTNGKNENNTDYKILYTYTKPMKNVMDYDVDTANEILDAAGYIWNDDHTVREIGPVAARRLVNMSFASSVDACLGKELSFNDLITPDSWSRQVDSDLNWMWESIGIDLERSEVNLATWGTMVYGYQFDYTLTYWSGDVDPNYLLFVPTSYTIGSWNEFGTEDPVYDSLYKKQSSIFNYTERKYWVDECQKWQYLSGHMVYVCYPLTTFGFNEIRWTNWGNWSEHPGLAIDYYWGEVPLLNHIRYIGGETSSDWTAAIVIGGAIVAVVVATVYVRARRKKIELSAPDEEEEKGPE